MKARNAGNSKARALPRGVEVTHEAGGLTIRYANRSRVDWVVLLFGLMLILLAAEFLFQVARGVVDGLRAGIWAWFALLGVSLMGVGLYTVYRGLAQMLNQTVIEVSLRGVRVVEVPLPLPGEHPLTVKAIRGATCVPESVYVYNRAGVREVELYNLRAQTWERGEVDLLSGLADADAVKFMAAAIEAWLNQQAGPV